MTEAEQKTDLPKVVAAIGVKIPLLTVRLGVSYLRLKGRANRASKTFVTELEKGGMPPLEAKRLGETYASDISIRKFLKQTGGGGIQGIRMR